MAEETIAMTQKAIDRLAIIQQVTAKQLRQQEAARQLGLSVRQVKRLVARFRQKGPSGLVSGHLGKRPGNAIPGAVRKEVLSLVRTRYPDFGPTLACEKLTALHGYKLSAETLRQWMIADGLWKPGKRKAARIHQRRPRRPCRGELIQIDGSPHDWFEGRGPRCTLIVFIDDATSELMALRFAPAETTWAYLQTLQGYLAEHGRPAALYSDKHSIFRVNQPEREGELTQFTRALKTLDIEPIHANTPQAKGRVERANQTLQDRLVKELRLAGISDIETANAWLPGFMRDFNARFAKPAQNATDAHRPVLHTPEELALILCLHNHRKLSKNLTFQFRNREYQLTGYGKGYRLRGARITICEAQDGHVTVLHKGHQLDWQILSEGEPPVPLDDEKSLHQRVDKARARQKASSGRKPAPDHPWRRSPVGKAASGRQSVTS
ncbi:ISNCY family transposase [Hahella sp. SMD15-11]|uniref:ISNCY family transposase n=1 Tax=Thermohahella caldifontis TaxID=3142973 RepID=A0AB39V0G4_9GAMM